MNSDMTSAMTHLFGRSYLHDHLKNTEKCDTHSCATRKFNYGLESSIYVFPQLLSHSHLEFAKLVTPDGVGFHI